MKGLSGTRAFALAAGILAVGPSAGFGEPIALTLDPVHPTTADTVTVRAHFDPLFCWPRTSSSAWQAPLVEGRTIRIANGTPIPDPPLCQPAPADYEGVLPALGEGSWSIDFVANGVAAARAFDVTAPSNELFLHGGRFVATVSWRGRDGQSHDARAVALGDDSGAFWFFDSGNIEITVKMLDGAGLNGKLWVFLASMTDVAYTVTVIDRSLVCVTTPCPNVRVYEGLAGQNRNALDTSAFDATAAPGEAGR